MRTKLIAILLLQTVMACGQKYKPTIVVLDPYQWSYDSLLSDEIEKFGLIREYNIEESKAFVEGLKSEPYNIKQMKLLEREYRKKLNFGSSFTYSLEIMLTYMVFGQTEKCIVFPSHDTSNGTIESLKNMSLKHDVQWVVNPVKLNSYINDDGMFTAVRLQVYGAKKGELVLDEVYTGDSKNPGLELSCEKGTLNCTINNVIDPSLHDILLTILGSYQH